MIKRYSDPHQKRRLRTRFKIRRRSLRPRLTVFRSLKHISAQIIDDAKAITLTAVSSVKLSKVKQSKLEQARLVGDQLAGLALKKKITSVVFDRGSYQYHGRVKALAEAARKAGLKF